MYWKSHILISFHLLPGPERNGIEGLLIPEHRTWLNTSHPVSERTQLPSDWISVPLAHSEDGLISVSTGPTTCTSVSFQLCRSITHIADEHGDDDQPLHLLLILSSSHDKVVNPWCLETNHVDDASVGRCSVSLLQTRNLGGLNCSERRAKVISALYTAFAMLGLAGIWSLLRMLPKKPKTPLKFSTFGTESTSPTVPRYIASGTSDKMIGKHSTGMQNSGYPVESWSLSDLQGMFKRPGLLRKALRKADREPPDASEWAMLLPRAANATVRGRSRVLGSQRARNRLHTNFDVFKEQFKGQFTDSLV
ncbi:hypothetical protein NUU61_006488 [Penicillium alfredii]|uniref:Uncharacterized protein n=1 Tax=Penicillium alfredii TaxID=1506179 RepID=A0A9W9K3D4_9EURO|nr:uncharacterized protein NUU61_006488 [Penicillium alfredii]KAJ5091618.1 hypothetical protein NUU61_006488 [Penicillium alfredii]